VLADDRRAAAAELRDLVVESRAAQFAVGAIGLPALTSVLRDERDDVELAHGCLEVLVNAVTAGGSTSATDAGGDPDASGGHEGGMSTNTNRSSNPGPSGPGAANAEALARNPANLELLLSLLDESDFYVRYHCVQLLTALSASNAHQMQEAIMSNPLGVGRLMDMMLEREVGCRD
jgi:hypothetical protein